MLEKLTFKEKIFYSLGSIPNGLFNVLVGAHFFQIPSQPTEAS